MKCFLKLVALICFVTVFIPQITIDTACFAETGVKEENYDLSTDPRLAEPLESFKQAEVYMAKGNNEFSRRAGLAQKLFEHAEDYYLKAAFLYSELGEKYGINTEHEVAVCDRRQRKAHVMVNKSRKKSRKRSGGF